MRCRLKKARRKCEELEPRSVFRLLSRRPVFVAAVFEAPVVAVGQVLLRSLLLDGSFLAMLLEPGVSACFGHYVIDAGYGRLDTAGVIGVDAKQGVHAGLIYAFSSLNVQDAQDSPHSALNATGLRSRSLIKTLAVRFSAARRRRHERYLTIQSSDLASWSKESGM